MKDESTTLDSGPPNPVDEELRKHPIDVVDGNSEATADEAPDLPEGVVPVVERVAEPVAEPVVEPVVGVPKTEVETDSDEGDQAIDSAQSDEQDATDGLVTNKDKAEDMAYAAKPDMDAAIEAKTGPKRIQELAEQIKEVSGEYLLSLNDEEEEQLRQRHRVLNRKMNSLLQEVGWAPNPDDIWNPKDALDRAELASKGFESVEKYHRERADKIAEWAAVLHDHPVSESYLASHEGIDFSPRSLYLMEVRIASELEDVKAIEEAIEKSGALVGIFGLQRAPWLNNYNGDYLEQSPREIMEAQYGYEPEDGKTEGRSQEELDKWKEWDTLRNDPNTTLQQLKDFFISLTNASIIEPSRSYTNSVKAVVEDVRSGRASE